jgi:hypothetical protein
MALPIIVHLGSVRGSVSLTMIAVHIDAAAIVD